MTWEATFIDPVERDGRIVCTIVYSDGNRKVPIEYVFDAALTDPTLEAIARAEVARLSAVAVKVPGKLTYTSGQAINIAEPAVVVVEATKGEQARTAWLGDYHKLQRQQFAAGLGLVDVAALQERVKAGYLPEYEAYLA